MLKLNLSTSKRGAPLSAACPAFLNPVFLSFALLLALMSAQAKAGKFVNLGPQISMVSVQGSAFIRVNGQEQVYMALRGQPGHLVGFHVADGKRIVDAELPGAHGSWSLAASTDGRIYAAGDNGHLYRYQPGESAVEDLGQAVPGQIFIWDLAAGEHGDIFGGTYAGAHVFKFNPKFGFTDITRGPVVPREEYVRSIAYNQGHVFAGVGTVHAHLVEIDPATGKKTELLARELADEMMTYALVAIPDSKSGDRLLVWSNLGNQVLVFNLKTRKVEREIDTPAIKAAQKSPDGQDVYYSDGTSLLSFNLDRPGEKPNVLGPCERANSMDWLDSDHLCAIDAHGRLVEYIPSKNSVKQINLDVPPQPILIQSCELGPDGKIWMGGYLAGGTACYDPMTGKSEQFPGLDQIERIGVLGSDLYFGIYPHAQLYRYTPGATWTHSNPHKLAQIGGQSRPMAMLGVPELQKVFIGLVPEYGRLGGDLLSYDPATDQLHDYGVVEPLQSIVSLVYSHGVLLGGTSTAGGLGIKPAMKEASLFGWDPINGKKLFEFHPVTGATSLTCLMNGPDGNVWGIAGGTLFIFDTTKQKVIHSQELMKVDYGSRVVWRDGFMVLHPSGQLYGTLNGRLFQLDPATRKMTVLRDHDANLLAMDREGRLYFRDTINLWQYMP